MAQNPSEIEQTMPVRPSRTAAATEARLRKQREKKEAEGSAQVAPITGSGTTNATPISVADSSGAPTANKVSAGLPSHYTDEALAREDAAQPEMKLEILKDDWGNELDYASSRAENPFDVTVKPWQDRFPEMAFYWFHPDVVDKLDRQRRRDLTTRL